MMSVTSSSPSSVSSMKVASSIGSLDLDVILALRPPRHRPLLALRPRRRLPRARRIRPPASRRTTTGLLPAPRGRAGLGTRARPATAQSTRHDTGPHRADDRVLVQVVELARRNRTDALGAELGFCHGPGFPRESEMRRFTWLVARPLSIAPVRILPALSGAAADDTLGPAVLGGPHLPIRGPFRETTPPLPPLTARRSRPAQGPRARARATSRSRTAR